MDGTPWEFTPVLCERCGTDVSEQADAAAMAEKIEFKCPNCGHVESV